MKIPDSWNEKLNKESSHKTKPFNTMTMLGISLVWGHMLSLISIWMLPVTILTLAAAYGSEIEKRQSR